MIQDADMHACTEHLSPREICERLGEITGVDFELVPLTPEQFHTEEHKQKIGEMRWTHLRAYTDGSVLVLSAGSHADSAGW